MKGLNYCFVIAAIAFFSCTNPRYINSPSAYNASFFREKGDMKFSGSASVNPSGFNRNFTDAKDDVDNGFGVDGQAAFALTDHFLLQVGGLYRSEWDHFADDDIGAANNPANVSYKRSLFNVGAGYYTRMGQSNNYFNLVLDGAFGKMASVDESDPTSLRPARNWDANLFKISLQPSLNFFFNDVFRMSFAPRFALLKFNNITTNYSSEEIQKLGYNKANDKMLPLFEPSLHLQAGPRSADWLKFDLGFNFATNPLVSGGNNVAPVVEGYDLYSRQFLLTFGVSIYPARKK